MSLLQTSSAPLGRPDPVADMALAEPHVLVIEATRGWRSLGLRDVWEFRELLGLLILRDIQGRYRQMAFGPLWMILAPLIQMVIFSLLFGAVFKLPSDGVPYPVFTYVALLPWMLFANAARNAAGSLVAQQHLIAKIYFPRLIIPLSQAVSALVDFFVSLVILLAMMMAYRIVPGARVLFLPAYLLLALATALAVGLWLATLAVKFRDVLVILGLVITAWQYATPVAYTSSLIPERWQALYRLNPMTIVVDGFRWSLLGVGAGPRAQDLAVAGVVLALLAAGAFSFRRTERTIVDTL